MTEKTGWETDPDQVIGTIDPFWSSEAVELRKQSVGAIHHPPPPPPRGLRANIANRRMRRKLWRAYRARRLPHIAASFDDWSDAYAAGKIDLDTGEYTDAARAESMAAIGGPFYVDAFIEADVPLPEAAEGDPRT